MPKNPKMAPFQSNENWTFSSLQVYFLARWVCTVMFFQLTPLQTVTQYIVFILWWCHRFHKVIGVFFCCNTASGHDVKLEARLSIIVLLLYVHGSSIRHRDLQSNCWQHSCIVGNVGTGFWQEKNGNGIKHDISGSASTTLIIFLTILLFNYVL